MPTRALLLSLLFGVATACTSTPASAPTSEVEAPPTPTEPPPAEMSLVDPSEPPEVEAFAQAPDVNLNTLSQRLRALGVLMQEMKRGAAAAAETEEGECEKAYASVVAAMAISSRGIAAMPGVSPPRWEVMRREEYLRVCASLPEDLRACARYDYRADHRGECVRAEREATEEHRDLFNRMARAIREDGTPVNPSQRQGAPPPADLPTKN